MRRPLAPKSSTSRLPDFGRADPIGEFCGHPKTRSFGELLIDLEEDKAARAKRHQSGDQHRAPAVAWRCPDE
jgi:hypothetical protein